MGWVYSAGRHGLFLSFILQMIYPYDKYSQYDEREFRWGFYRVRNNFDDCVLASILYVMVFIDIIDIISGTVHWRIQVLVLASFLNVMLYNSLQLQLRLQLQLQS